VADQRDVPRAGRELELLVPVERVAQELLDREALMDGDDRFRDAARYVSAKAVLEPFGHVGQCP
jgi:hypothetical protein